MEASEMKNSSYIMGEEEIIQNAPVVSDMDESTTNNENDFNINNVANDSIDDDDDIDCTNNNNNNNSSTCDDDDNHKSHPLHKRMDSFPSTGSFTVSDTNSDLLEENERLKLQVEDLERKVENLKSIIRREDTTARGGEGDKKQKRITFSTPKVNNNNGIVLEFPKSLAALLRIPQVGKEKGSRATFDDQDTLETELDLEAHESSGGLIHRKTRDSHNEAKNSDKKDLLAHDELSSVSQTDDDGLEVIPIEHKNEFDESFIGSLKDRAGWLVGLLVFQSMSSFILARNEGLIARYSVIVQFLTMLVGAGGNAGNQASVRVIRGLAVGSITESNVKFFLQREVFMGICVSVVLGVAGCIRVAIFKIPFLETVAITSSLCMIVMISIVLGSTLPMGMKQIGIDPAHSSTTIQVIMDILGVTITCQVCSFILDSGYHAVTIGSS